ncbi:inactive serine/threonine-protein kinase TEX14 [Patella vulgata]|uniref:inactive serine/threonine-protein kinase TEX14 n=1 Tax=Patella vulgata TaxID=6465 RepID=UPI0024A913D4|nr:inactive serine/threonine-protein kinase TEX14 [Patella vulgata]
MGSPIHLGKMVSSDKLGVSLHGAAKQGNKRAVKRAIDKGIYVDYPNDEGQTPLFCACFANQEGVAKLLLQRGADPNEKSNNGQTPVLMICLRGNISLLQKMMDAGGDLRYHDNDGRGCIDWALMNEDPKKRIKMIDFINKTRVHAMTSAEQEVRFRKDSNRRSRTMLTVPESLVDIIRKKLGGTRPLDSTNSISRVESRGFGRVYTGEKDGGLVSVTPLVPEANLQFDAYGPSFDNGAFMAMESMFWYKSTVTVKKLHKVTQPGGYIDLLITEAERLGKLHHPNILLLMGVCQAYTMDSMMLVFERINVGSIYYYLHAKLERLPTQNIRDIVIQICDAMIFLHQNDIIHCNLSSHAVFLVNPYSAKIGNFEYAMDSEKAGLGKQSAASQMKYQNALYNWMAPELMDGNEPGFYSDVYSYCCLLWEIFVCEVPWDMCDAELIKHKLLAERQSLMRENDKIPNLFKTIIRYGLEIEYNTRMLDFETIRTWLAAPPDSIPTLPQRHMSLEETEPKCIDDVDGYTKHAGKMVDDRHRQHNTSPNHQRKHSPSPDKAGSTRHPRSSSYCHNENNHHDHHHSEHRSRKQKQEWYDDEDDVDFCKNEAYNYYEKHPKSPGKRSLPGHYTRKTDGVQFDVNRHNDGQMVGYHVKVRSPKTRQKHQSRSRPNSYQKDLTNTESSNEERRFV